MSMMPVCRMQNSLPTLNTLLKVRSGVCAEWSMTEIRSLLTKMLVVCACVDVFVHSLFIHSFIVPIELLLYMELLSAK